MRVAEGHGTRFAGSGRAVAGLGRWSALGRLAGSWALPWLVVGVATVVGVALRLVVAGQSVFADELSTYWIVSTNGLGGVVSTVHSDAEITPPLFFVASWLTTRVELTPELLRAPSLVAGAATIPLTYLLGLRTVGRAAGLVGAALTALSPFMIFYSAEARGYALMVALVLLSTLALLAGVDDRRGRWWVVYGACSGAAVYTHYTAVFVLGAQLVWLLWAHPAARKAALLANAAAVVAFLPWLSGLLADFDSPTTDILSEISPFDLRSARISLQHWLVGYPFVFSSTGLRELPGTAALGLLGVGVTLALAGLAARVRAQPRSWPALVERRFLLIIALALSTPVGEALVSAISTNLFGTRNLAASWPAFALCLAALLVAAGPRLRFAAAALAVASFAIGAAKLLDPQFQRPDYEAAAASIDTEAVSGDVVVDGTSVTPGPYSGLDVAFDRFHRVFRVGIPQQRDHPFRIGDPVFPVDQVTRDAAAAAAGGRIFIASSDTPFAPTVPAQLPRAEQVVAALPAGYRRVGERTYSGSLRLVVSVYANRASRRE
jgi:hypothetical protein